MSNTYFRFFKREYLNDPRPGGELFFTVPYTTRIGGVNFWSTYYLQQNMFDYLINEGIYPEYIDDVDYILCPIYSTRDGSTISDVQFAVTETFKQHETEIESFKRAMGEECGLRHSLFEPPRWLSDFQVRRGLNVYPALVNIDETHPVLRPKGKGRGRDDSSRKTCLIVRGTEDEMKDFLNTPRILLDKSDDIIIGLAAIRFSDIRSHFS